MEDGLIIDDNRNTADALHQMLELLELPARVSYGSSPAMTVLGHMVPRFVCLDINMPGVDGTEVLAYIRRDPIHFGHATGAPRGLLALSISEGAWPLPHRGVWAPSPGQGQLRAWRQRSPHCGLQS
jgi:CheY-like chemotaxis protein